MLSMDLQASLLLPRGVTSNAVCARLVYQFGRRNCEAHGTRGPLASSMPEYVVSVLLLVGRDCGLSAVRHPAQLRLNLCLLLLQP